MSLPRNVVTAIGIGFEWHGGIPGEHGWKNACHYVGLHSQIYRPQIPCGRVTLTATATSLIASQDGLLRYPPQEVSPADPCNKVAEAYNILQSMVASPVRLC
jgi:hypothetical protein